MAHPGNEWAMPDLRTDDGRTFPVRFHRDSGQLVATMPDGTTTRAFSWADLSVNVRTKIRRSLVQVEIPFIASDTGRRGEAVGLHTKTNHPLVRWSNGVTEQYTGNAVPLRPDADIAALNRLRDEAEQARKAVGRFIEDHRINLTVAGMVRRAVDAALDETPTDTLVT